jgi:ABC-type lipoprotein export system ATPase subunit
MIKLRQLDKYYNRKKANEIHVLNDITLDLPDSGLVVLLGPSGSGKTTLLNVLGGLDKVRSGTIDFGDVQIDRYKSNVWDKIRNKEVGYVFQNYNLLTNLTVYDNISLTLNMIGIYDKDEIDKRIDYILDNMGMINYRKRRASQLSGGQQQRVAIARALAKNPRVIIADEPTGNLDSKNTQDIMNILKAISQTKLVVLVTHEEDIANFYGDRIIRLRDGQIISDVSNRGTGTLGVQHDTDIYLKDLTQTVDTKTTDTTLSVYTDENVKDKLDVRLIVKNKTLYIDVKSQEYHKLQLVDKDSEVRILNESFHTKEEAEVFNSDFDLNNVISSEHTDHEKHSVISIKDSLRLAWGRVKDSTKLGKVFYLAFVGIAALIALAVGMGNSYVQLRSEDFLQDSKELVQFHQGEVYTYDEMMAFLDDPSIDYVRIVEDFNFSATLPPLFQAGNNVQSHRFIPVDIEFMDESKIVSGRDAETPFEFVLDKRLANQLIESTSYRYLGITTFDDLYKIDFYFTVPGLTEDVKIYLELVGIVDDESPVMYLNEDIMYMQQFQVGVYELYQDDITLEQGTLIDDPETDIIVIENDGLNDPLNLNTWNVLNNQHTVVGTFTTDIENMPFILAERDYLIETYYESTHNSKYSEVQVYSNEIDATIAHLDNEGFEAESYYDVYYEFYRADRLSQGLGTITFILVVLVATAISYFFVSRSSLLARIYEISVYRALGVTKGDIRKLFIVETILVTTLTSLLGYAITTAIMWRIQILAEDYMQLIHVTPFSIAVGVLLIYAVNILSGLIPVSNLLRRTPAEILSKYDF